MPKKALTKEQVGKIVTLRKTGHSLPEIRRMTKHSNATVFKYIGGVKVLPEYAQILKSKQGGSEERSRKKWEEAKMEVRKSIGVLSERDKLFVLIALYWGEGTKGSFNLINGDPYLIKVFVSCLLSFGIPKERIKIGIRVFSGMNIKEMKSFWAKILDVNPSVIKNLEIVQGSLSNKLPHGMCRVRVEKGEFYFKRIMSMIDFIKLSV